MRKKKSPLHLVSCCDGTYDMYEYFGICTLHLEKIPRAQYLYFLAIFRRYLFVFEHFRRAHGLSSTPLRDPLIAGRVRSRSAMLSRGRVRTWDVKNMVTRDYRHRAPKTDKSARIYYRWQLRWQITWYVVCLLACPMSRLHRASFDTFLTD